MVRLKKISEMISSDFVMVLLLGFLSMGIVVGYDKRILPLFLVIFAGYFAVSIFVRNEELARKAKTALLLSLITIVAILPGVSRINATHKSPTPVFTKHDGAVQVEEAVKMLLNGKNPYVENYANTPVFLFGGDMNPALYCLVYLPFVLYITIPAHVFSNFLIGWFDVRMLLMAFFIASIFFIYEIADLKRKLVGVAAFSLLPLVNLYLVLDGRNDILPIALYLLVLLALQKNKLDFALAFLAAATATKQTAWPLVPFVLLYVARDEIKSGRWRTAAIKLWVFFAILLLLVAPFILWSPYDFFADVVLYGFGLAKTYNISPENFGLMGILVRMNVINAGDVIPLWVPMFVFDVPIMLFLLRDQMEDNSIKRVALNYLYLLAFLLIFSRFFHMNHLAHLYLVAVIWYVL